MCGHVQGLCQTPCRAELTAMFFALEWAKQRGLKVRVWMDCLGVLRGIKRLQKGQLVRVNRAHSGLWQRLQGLFEDWSADQVQLIKVVSHGSLCEAQRAHRSRCQHQSKRVLGYFGQVWQEHSNCSGSCIRPFCWYYLVLLKTGGKAHMDKQKKGVVSTPMPRQVSRPQPNMRCPPES